MYLVYSTHCVLLIDFYSQRFALYLTLVRPKWIIRDPMSQHFNTLRTGIFFLYIYHKSLIQSKVTFFKSGPEDQLYVRCTYCVIKCVKPKRVLKGKFASSVFHS
jgi:hypothetical protein